MNLIAFLLLGLIAGAIARSIMPDRVNGGWVVSLIVGVVGSFLGGWLGSTLLGWNTNHFFSIKSWILAIVGSLITLAIYGFVTKKKA